jgi:hypothetical protein
MMYKQTTWNHNAQTPTRPFVESLKWQPVFDTKSYRMNEGPSSENDWRVVLVWSGGVIQRVYYTTRGHHLKNFKRQKTMFGTKKIKKLH